jgi:hypothetical protein
LKRHYTAFAKLKHLSRKAAARTIENICIAIAGAALLQPNVQTTSKTQTTRQPKIVTL